MSTTWIKKGRSWAFNNMISYHCTHSKENRKYAEIVIPYSVCEKLRWNWNGKVGVSLKSVTRLIVGYDSSSKTFSLKKSDAKNVKGYGRKLSSTVKTNSQPRIRLYSNVEELPEANPTINIKDFVLDKGELRFTLPLKNV